MTEPVVTVSAEATLDEVVAVFEHHRFSAVPVIDADRLVGLVSTTDVLRALERGSARSGAAGAMMTATVLVARPEEVLDDAIRRLVAGRVHRLVVTDRDRPVGILATRDLYEEIVARRLTTPLQSIMTADVMTVDLGDSIDAATERLTESNVHGLVVLDGTWPIGVYTHREAIAARKLPHALRQRPVEEVMSYETICLDRATPIFRAAAHGAAMNVRRFLVVEHRRLVGIVSSLDLASSLGFAAAKA